jgi:hypothetical protein
MRQDYHGEIEVLVADFTPVALPEFAKRPVTISPRRSLKYMHIHVSGNQVDQLRIGSIRNCMHLIARGDILVNMDADDYYGASYVSGIVDEFVKTANPTLIVGGCGDVQPALLVGKNGQPTSLKNVEEPPCSSEWAGKVGWGMAIIGFAVTIDSAQPASPSDIVLQLKNIDNERFLSCKNEATVISILQKQSEDTLLGLGPGYLDDASANEEPQVFQDVCASQGGSPYWRKQWRRRCQNSFFGAVMVPTSASHRPFCDALTSVDTRHCMNCEGIALESSESARGAPCRRIVSEPSLCAYTAYPL